MNLRVFVLGLSFLAIIGCGDSAPPPLDPVETEAKEEEISEAMEKAMEEQMGGKNR